MGIKDHNIRPRIAQFANRLGHIVVQRNVGDAGLLKRILQRLRDQCIIFDHQGLEPGKRPGRWLIFAHRTDPQACHAGLLPVGKPAPPRRAQLRGVARLQT